MMSLKRPISFIKKFEEKFDEDFEIDINTTWKKTKTKTNSPDCFLYCYSPENYKMSIIDVPIQSDNQIINDDLIEDIVEVNSNLSTSNISPISDRSSFSEETTEIRDKHSLYYISSDDEVKVEYDKNMQRIVHMFTSIASPSIDKNTYLIRLIKLTRCSKECFAIATIYMSRFFEVCHLLKLSNCNYHRIIITSLILAIKYQDDKIYTMKAYSIVSGIEVKELIFLEIEMLNALNFNLYVTKDEYDNERITLLDTISVKFIQTLKPQINFNAYIKNLVKYLKCDYTCEITAQIYTNKVLERLPILKNSKYDSQQIYLFSLIVALKYFKPGYCDNNFYKKINCVSLSKYEELEYYIIYMLDYVVKIDDKSYIEACKYNKQ